MDDRTLVNNILARDRTALQTFYRMYSGKLLRFIHRKVGNDADSEEILQDTLFAFLEALRDFQGTASVQTFLYSICHHKIVDYYRRKKLRSVVFSQMPNLEALVSPLTGPEETLDTTLLREKIRAVLGSLLPIYRQILQAKYVEDRSVAEIAERLAITFKSAESKLFRARKAFVEAFIAT